MKLIVGIIIVFGSVLGGFVLSHGNPYALVQPYELLVIGGAALGAFVIANNGEVIKKVFKGLPGLLSGAKQNKALYLDLLALMYDLFNKTRREGLMALENDVDAPEESDVFSGASTSFSRAIRPSRRKRVMSFPSIRKY